MVKAIFRDAVQLVGSREAVANNSKKILGCQPTQDVMFLPPNFVFKKDFFSLILES